MRKTELTSPLPVGHRLVETADGTPTLFSERFNEACHSLDGAAQETREHYLRGCRVEELLASLPQVNVLEVGFGTGLGFRLTRELAVAYPACFLNFVSLELDEELVRWALPHAERGEEEGSRVYRDSSPTHRLTVLVGDARATLPRYHALERFHAVYQDAFSPKRNPTLWTTEWFTLLGRLSHPQARLSTYSASVAVRKALHAAGWGIGRGPGFGKKRTSTRASWQTPSDQAILEELRQHPAGPLRDPT